MFYANSDTDDYLLTTSYTTDKQAKRYNGDPFESELHLSQNNVDGGLNILDIHEFDDTEDNDLGIVRTILRRKSDPKGRKNYILYIHDSLRGWYDSGIFFDTMSDANQVLKGPLSKCFADMLILQDPKAPPNTATFSDKPRFAGVYD